MSEEIKKIDIDNDYKQHFENIELKDGKILNADRDFNYDYHDFHGEERFSIKEGKLEGLYECKSYTGHPSVAFAVKANFKDGVLDGPFVMENNGHIIKNGSYVNGVFHGEDNSKKYSDAMDTEIRFNKTINNIQEKCLNQPKDWRFDDPTKTTATNRLASLRKKITHDIDEALGTNLEKKKMPLKGLEAGVSRIVEKMVSNKKVKD